MSWIGKKMPDYAPGRTSQVKTLGSSSSTSPQTGEILSVPPQELMDALTVLCASGCGILISPTGDGGALSVTVYAGDQRHRAYVTSSASFSDALTAARDVAEAHMVGGPAKRQNGPLRETHNR